MREENLCWENKIHEELKSRRTEASPGLWLYTKWPNNKLWRFIYCAYLGNTVELGHGWRGQQKILESHTRWHLLASRGRRTPVWSEADVVWAQQGGNVVCGPSVGPDSWWSCPSSQPVQTCKNSGATASTRCSQELKFRTQNLLQSPAFVAILFGCTASCPHR